MNEFDRRLQEQEEQESRNSLQKLGDLKGDLTEKVKKNREHIGDFLYFILFSLILVAMLGIFELLTPSYDKQMFASVLFWVDYAIIQTAIWSSRIMVKKLGDRKEYRNNKTYLSYEKNIVEKVLVDKEEPYIDELAIKEDKERKIQTFKNQQKLAIINIGIKYRINNLFEHLKHIETAEISNLTPFYLKSDISIKDRKQKRLNSKLNELFKTLTNEWIDKNIDTQKVKYNKISRAILTSGISSSGNNNLGEDFKEHATREFLKLTIPTALFTMAFTFLILPLDGDWRKDANAWFKFISKLLMVVITSIFMWVDNPMLFNRTKNKAIGERSNKLNQFYKKKFDNDEK